MSNIDEKDLDDFGDISFDDIEGIEMEEGESEEFVLDTEETDSEDSIDDMELREDSDFIDNEDFQFDTEESIEEYTEKGTDDSLQDDADDFKFESADDDGAIMSGNSLLEEDDEFENVGDSNFISDTGDIVVMDNSDKKEDNFTLKYVDIKNVAIINRIRKNNNVEDLVKSIKSTGLLNPIVVSPTATDDIFVLLDGFRRIIACAKAGIRRVPCVVNNKVSTLEIPVLEALYNHSKAYSIKEVVEYIEYLEKEKGIMSASMIEYLLQMNSGDYTKLKDLLNDDDEDIVGKLFEGQLTIEQAFKKLEQRRKKESAEEKAIKKAEKVYEDEKQSGADNLHGSGEQSDDSTALTDEELKNIAIGASQLEEDIEEVSLDDMVKAGNDIKGFEVTHQKVGERTPLDPALRKSVLVRDNYTCQCCKTGGTTEWVDCLDVHHIVPVMLDNGTSSVGGDRMENLTSLCLNCHRQLHLYSTGDLIISPEKTEEELEKMTEDDKVIYQNDRRRLKRVVKLGNVIREGLQQRGYKKEQIKKDFSAGNIGRNMPGKGKQNPDL